MEMLKELLIILVSTAFINNVVLSRFLGLCPFLGVSKKTDTAVGMGTAVVFVITISSVLTACIYKYILAPLGMEYMNTIVFIAVIAALVQLVEMFLKKALPALYRSLGVYLPLITTNCAVLGVALLNVQNGYLEAGAEYGILKSLFNGLGTSVGFCISIVLLAGIRERIEDNDITPALKGLPILLVTAGLMAMAFCGFAGLI